MVIEENKAIELSDGVKYLVEKKISYENNNYLLCLSLNDDPKIALLRMKGNNKVEFVKDDLVMGEVVLSTPEGKALLEKISKKA